jgi:hypothetical protein
MTLQDSINDYTRKRGAALADLHRLIAGREVALLADNDALVDDFDARIDKAHRVIERFDLIVDSLTEREDAFDKLARTIEEIGSLRAQHKAAMPAGDDNEAFDLERQIERAELAVENLEFEIEENKRRIGAGEGDR